MPTTTPQQNTRRPAPTQQGKVVRLSGATSAVVEVSHVVEHPKYRKRFTRAKTFLVNVRKGQEVTVGANVTIAETRPRSAAKRWRIV